MTSLNRHWPILRNTGYGSFLSALFCNGLAMQIQTVAVGWQLYEMTGDPMDLGYIGLSQFAPAFALFLVTGAAADRFPRRVLMAGCLAVMGIVSACFLALTWSGYLTPGYVFVLSGIFGLTRAFYNPVRQSLATNMVVAADLPKAMAINSSSFKIAMVLGPVLGGVLFGISAESAYGVAAGCSLVGAGLLLRIPRPAERAKVGKQDWQAMTAGLRYMWRNPVVLGATTLDLFVGLFGGAIALLPVYASDILETDATGLGVLRAAPAVGGVLIGLWLMRAPIQRKAGRTMFVTVAIFALATLVFAFSSSLWLSVVCLAVIGGSDMISVVIRQTMVQLNTPDEVRGRVNAVNVMFIGASNELGAFRAGTMAAFVGPVAAVAGGAVAALIVCGVWVRLFPQLRQMDSLQD